MDVTQRPLAWFSIPVSDIGRATAFYNRVFELAIEIVDYQGQGMAHFPASQSHAGGALIQDPGRTGQSGVLVYFNAGQELSPYLQRVQAAGGRVSQAKTDIGSGWGFYAHFIDSEGNEIGLWSPE